MFGCATTAGTSAADFFPWVQRLANAFGSPNFLYANHICGWHRGGSAQYTYGVSMPQPDYEQARCMLLWGYNPQASQPADAMRISRAKARGAKLIVIDPHKASVVDKADCWLRVRPGSDGALALAMIHVLLEEALYDAAFVRDWTNGPFLVREDTQQLLTERDLAPAGHPETFFAWDSRRAAPVAYRPDRGYAQDGVDPALSGTYAFTLADGTTVQCRPALALLKELAAQYAPERSEALTWVPAADVRRAVRMFATEQPSCYFTWVGLEEHTNATQTSRAVSLFYALTGQFDRRGSNVLFASTATNPIVGRELLPKEQACRTLGYAERPLGPPGTAGHVTAYDMYRAILTAQPYPVKGLVTFGTDVLMGNGDPLQGKAALEALDFYVHVDLFANPSASLADLLLPACHLLGARRPSGPPWVQGRRRPPGRSSESPWCNRCTSPGLRWPSSLTWPRGWAWVEHFFDGDIEAAYDYELAPSGLTVQQLRQHPMGMRARGETRFQKYAEIDAATGQPRGFPTPTRKVEIYSTRFARAGYAPLPVYQEPESPDSARHGPGVSAGAHLLPAGAVLRRATPQHPASAAPGARAIPGDPPGNGRGSEHSGRGMGHPGDRHGADQAEGEVQRFPASWGRRHRARLVAGLPGAGAARLRPLWAGGGKRQPSRLQRCH